MSELVTLSDYYLQDVPEGTLFLPSEPIFTPDAGAEPGVFINREALSCKMFCHFLFLFNLNHCAILEQIGSFMRIRPLGRLSVVVGLIITYTYHSLERLTGEQIIIN